MPVVAVTAPKADIPRAPLPSPLPTTADDASSALLEQLLNSSATGAADTVLVRALGEEADVLRDAAMKAAEKICHGPGLSLIHI